jgi:hypothetical protein
MRPIGKKRTSRDPRSLRTLDGNGYGKKSGKPAAESAGRGLLADAELSDDSLIALGIVLLEVVEQATPLADQHEEAAARAVVLLVRFEMVRQLTDAFTEQRDLNLRATGVVSVCSVLVDEGLFVISG